MMIELSLYTIILSKIFENLIYFSQAFQTKNLSH